jgi:hypothetical protein
MKISTSTGRKVPKPNFLASLLFALLKKADVSKPLSKDKNLAFADCQNLLYYDGLERSVVIGDIRFLIGLAIHSGH